MKLHLFNLVFYYYKKIASMGPGISQYLELKMRTIEILHLA